jgi:hypothetical protein
MMEEKRKKKKEKRLKMKRGVVIAIPAWREKQSLFGAEIASSPGYPGASQ